MIEPLFSLYMFFVPTLWVRDTIGAHELARGALVRERHLTEKECNDLALEVKAARDGRQIVVACVPE